jgi:hypothetical protein
MVRERRQRFAFVTELFWGAGWALSGEWAYVAR